MGEGRVKKEEGRRTHLLKYAFRYFDNQLGRNINQLFTLSNFAVLETL